MIESIELRNWKTHKQTTLKFQKGVNVLIGIMGAGKSSVLDAISFALFGTFPMLSSKRVSLTGLITNKPKKENEALVSLTFTVDNDVYKVTRKITEKGSTAKLEKNGAQIQAQSTKVTEEIERLLKLDYDTFSRVIYSEQNGLDYFLDLARVERKREIDHMLGLDSFSRAEENATTLINNLRSSISSIEENISKIDKKALLKAYEELDVEKNNIEKELSILKGDETTIEKILNEEKNELEKLKRMLDERKRLEDEASKLKGNIDALSKEIEKLSSEKLDAAELRLKLDEARRKEELFREELDNHNKSIIENERHLAGIESKLNEASKKLDEKKKLEELLSRHDQAVMKKKYEEAAEKLNNIRSDEVAYTRRIDELKKALEELEVAKGRCPVCGGILDEEHKQKLKEEKSKELEKIKSAINENKKNTVELEKTKRELEESLKKLDIASSRLSEYRDIDKNINELNENSKIYREKLNLVKERYNSLKNDAEKIRKPISELEAKLRDAERLERYLKEYDAYKKKLEEVNEKAKSINVDEKKVYALQENITKDSSKLADIKAKISSNMRYSANIKTQLDEKKKLINNLEEMEDSIKRKRSTVENLNKFKLALVATQATLRTQLVSSINELMLQLWPRLYPYADYNALRLNALSDDYLLELNTSINNEWIQVDGVASGGERSIACLIMRIALAMVVVPNLKWLILDEPTHNIDSNGIAKLIDILGNELPNIVEQVFIITHEDSLKQISLAKIYQLNRDKSSSLSTDAVEV